MIRTLTIFTICIIALAAAVFAQVQVPDGSVAVLWERFKGGTDTSQVHADDFWTYRWNRVTFYDTGEQQRIEDVELFDAEGGECIALYEVDWALAQAQIANLHQAIGPEYVERLVLPDAESMLREHVAYSPPFGGELMAVAERIGDAGFPIEKMTIKIIASDCPGLSAVVSNQPDQALDEKPKI